MHYGKIKGGKIATLCGRIGIIAETAEYVSCPECVEKMNGMRLAAMSAMRNNARLRCPTAHVDKE